MPLSQWNLEFLNHNRQRSYPLTADSTKTDVTGSFRIPDDFLVGMDIPMSSSMDMTTGRFFIRQLGLFASGVQLTLSYDNGGQIMDIGTALIPEATQQNAVVALGGIDPFDDVNGKVVIGKLSTIFEQPTGLFNFTLDDTRVEPQAVRPMLRSITSLQIADAAGATSSRLYGDIELVAGSNVQLSTVVTAEETQIIISAISGEGTIENCVCEGAAAGSEPIRTINGVSPTPDGNINILGDNCLTFAAVENGIQADDACCAPCCGCEELEQITRDLEQFNIQRASLETFVNNLVSENTEFSVNILGARLGDRKCLTCE